MVVGCLSVIYGAMAIWIGYQVGLEVGQRRAYNKRNARLGGIWHG